MDVNLKPGTKVELRTKKGDFICRVLESPRSDVILVKLESGYNIGIREEDILDVKLIKEKEEKEKITKNKKEKNREELPNIALVVTGGTISSKLDSKTGAVKWLTDPKELLNAYPELLEFVNISRIEVPFMKASENMDSDDWEVISETTEKLLNDKNISGVIVTHGTDFLHYTAAALSYSLGKLNKPVVLTYSQRSSDRASSDARLNLICAARAAISDIAEVMIVGHGNENDDFCYALPGTKTRKMHTSRRDAFRVINSKPIAKITREKVMPITTYNVRSENNIKTNCKFSNKTALIKFYPGMPIELIDFYIKNGVKGIVIEGSGLGHVASSESKNNLLPVIKKAIKSNVSICIAPQTLYGKLNPKVYSLGRELEKTGVIFLEDMLPETALVKLSYILASPKLRSNVKKQMLTPTARDISEFISQDEFLN